MTIYVRRTLLGLLAGLTALAPLAISPPKALGGEQPEMFQHETGDPQQGAQVFRYETFGNEGFWTDAMQLPQGIAEAGLTPIQALQLGLNIDVNALNQATVDAVAGALTAIQGGTPPGETVLADPAVTLSVINQNAVVGVVVFDSDGQRKPLGNSGSLDIAGGDKVGVTCALCHAVTDNSILAPMPALGIQGSVGNVVSGRTPHNLDVGAILAAANNTLAYYPMLQLQFDSLGGATIGRGDFVGLSTAEGMMPTEAEADAYLTGTSEGSDERYYPVGSFDAFPDGIGNPVHIMPFLRTDLTAPWGFDGGSVNLTNFNNTVYTVSLDPTTLLTSAGGAFLSAIAGPAGEEIQSDYEAVMRQSGVLGDGEDPDDVFPYIEAQSGLTPGDPASVVGLRVDEQRLFDLNAYTDGLPPPLAPNDLDEEAADRGRGIFMNSGCVNCHRADPNLAVNTNVVPIESLYPGYAPMVIFPREDPLSDIQNSEGPSPTFDDRLIVVDASLRGEVRGFALPALYGLERKTRLLHDNSVAGDTFAEAADQLLDPARGEMAAHPVYIADPAQRADVAEFLRSLTTRAPMISEGGVLNAASFEQGNLAPGLIVSIFGEDIGPEAIAAGDFNEQGILTARLENTSVRIGGLPAPLLFVSPNQINAVTPFGITNQIQEPDMVTVEIERGGLTSESQMLPLAEVAPAIFTQNQTGQGPGAILNQDNTLNTAENPALRGTTIQVWGTGAGITTPESIDGNLNAGNLEFDRDITVTIGGEEVEATFAGGAPGLVAGVFQVNVNIDNDPPPGEQMLRITFDGIATQSGVTVFIQ